MSNALPRHSLQVRPSVASPKFRHQQTPQLSLPKIIHACSVPASAPTNSAHTDGVLQGPSPVQMALKKEENANDLVTDIPESQVGHKNDALAVTAPVTASSIKKDESSSGDAKMLSSPSSPALPPPTAHLRDTRRLPQAGKTEMLPPPRPVSMHARSQSSASAQQLQRRGNRLSLSFPIQPLQTARYTSTTTTASPSPSSSSMSVTTPASPSSSFAAPTTTGSLFSSPTASNGGGGGSSSFLVALASQERRVLELREELQRAEAELNALKRQWGAHEAVKKRGEGKQLEQMRMIRVGGDGGNDGSGEQFQQQTRRSREIDRLKTAGMMGTGRSTQRKVISGQRHTRTLSLLDPARLNGRNETVAGDVATEQDEKAQQSSSETLKPSTKVKKSDRDTNDRSRNSIHGPPSDTILRTGKQMAEDFKDGLWTFFEDLRQATVGDEAATSPTANRNSPVTTKAARRQASRGSLRRSNSARVKSKRSSASLKSSAKVGGEQHSADKKAATDVDTAFWREQGITFSPIAKLASAEEPQPTPTMSDKSAVEDEDDVWDSWGNSSPVPKGDPSPRWSSSTYVSEGGGGAAGSSPPSAMLSPASAAAASADGKRTEIPWPTLPNLTASSLTRTASTLMKEWEKSLTPPVEAPAEGKDYLDAKPETKNEASHGAKASRVHPRPQSSVIESVHYQPLIKDDDFSLEHGRLDLR